MSRTPVTVYPFVLVVVRKGDQFLLVQEKNISRGTWYLPAGGVDPGEGLIDAAIRETREEAGVDVIPRALVAFEDLTRLHENGEWAGRWRFIVRAEMEDESQEPHAADDTLGARWFTLEEVEALPLRAQEVADIIGAVVRGCPELPLDAGYK